MKPAKLDDGSKVDAFKLMKLIKRCRTELENEGKTEAAFYFEMLSMWLEEDIFGHGKPLEYTNYTLGL